MWQRQQHARDPIKEHTRVAVDDNAPFANSGHSAHVVDFCDPTSTVVQPRQDVDNKGDGRAEHALHFGDRVRWVRMSQRSSDHSANVVAEPTAMN